MSHVRSKLPAISLNDRPLRRPLPDLRAGEPVFPRRDIRPDPTERSGRTLAAGVCAVLLCFFAWAAIHVANG